jgi:hypothetical protein
VVKYEGGVVCFNFAHAGIVLLCGNRDRDATEQRTDDR